MWQRRSHILAPLTKLTSTNRKFKWTKVKQDTFEKLSGSWTVILYRPIRIFMKHL